MAADEEIARLQEQITHLKTVGKLEDELVAAKSDKSISDTKFSNLKLKVREARQAAREAREADRPAPVNGDAVASPDAVRVTANIKE